MRIPRVHVCLILVSVCVVCATESQKRAPSGFTGVRGKKSIPETAYEDDGSQVGALDGLHLSSNNGISDGAAVDKRAPSGFMGMRGKKPYPQAWVAYPENGYKRAPSGFFGMRGKKDMELKSYEEDYLKRAPSGFFGMRGKKDFEDDPYGSTAMEKRAPMGFMGMRGKKDYESTIGDTKRAPASGFFGMRGKKQPGRSGFFGMRGKKYPYEFRGKFVGVRGKKISDETTGPDYYSNNLTGDELEELREGLDINQLMLLLTENEGEGSSWPSKGTNDIYWPHQE